MTALETKQFIKIYFFFFLLVINSISLFAQRDIKIMSYNLLIYPQGEMVNRIDTLSKILDYYEPDLLLLQELKNEQGLQLITKELNDLFGNYSSGTYIPQISNPSNSWRLQQNVIYNENIFELVSEQTIETPYRDVNYFQLQFLEEADIPSSQLFHIYVTHLKSSQGGTNEQLRLSMVEVMNNHISLLPPNSNIIVAGDFNVYYSGEPAYELLLRSNGTNTLHDPIDMSGWASTDFPNKEIFTQSTRLSSLNDGSGGGLDDRFDFVLLSDQLMSPIGRFQYQDSSYRALGNNGTCYNQDLIACSSVDNVPFDILRSLYHMSDHLPVVLSLDVLEVVSTIDFSLTSIDKIKIAPNPAQAQIKIDGKGINFIDLRIFNLQGKLILEQPLMEHKTTVGINHLIPGLYIAHLTNKSTGALHADKLLIQR